MKDYQLDLVNAINNYNANMNDSEAILMVSCDPIGGSSLVNIEGNMNNLCIMISRPDIALKSSDGIDPFEYVAPVVNNILSIAMNLLSNDYGLRNEFYKDLKKLRKQKND